MRGLKIFWDFIVIAVLYYVFLRLFIWIFPLSFIVIVIKYTYRKKWSDSVPIMLSTLKESIVNFDKYCNREFRTLWNTFLIKESKGYKFGKVEETISSALGKNQKYHTEYVRFLGWVLIYALWVIDWTAWKKGGHCIASINDKI